MSLFAHNSKGTWVVYVLRGQNSKGESVVYLGMTRRGSLRHSPRVPGSTEWVPFPAPGGPTENQKKRKRRKKKKKERKSIALQDSTSALEKDSERLIEFIEDDNMKTKKKMQDAEKAADARRNAEAQIN